MNKNLIIIAIIASLFFLFSCKKIGINEPTTGQSQSSADIKVPVGFTWENSKYINFTVDVNDARFPGLLNMIAIYAGDPAAGGMILAKGSATQTAAFKCKIYLSNQISEVHVVKIAPDNSIITKKITLSSGNINVLMGT